jgi:hypothetical protein
MKVMRRMRVSEWMGISLALCPVLASHLSIVSIPWLFPNCGRRTGTFVKVFRVAFLGSGHPGIVRLSRGRLVALTSRHFAGKSSSPPPPPHVVRDPHPWGPRTCYLPVLHRELLENTEARSVRLCAG